MSGNKTGMTYETTRLSEHILNLIDDVFFGFISYSDRKAKKEINETEDSVCLTYLTSVEKVTLKIEKIK